MTHTRWVILSGAALLLLPMAAAFLFPPRVVLPIPEPQPVYPPIIYQLPPAQPNDLSGVAIRKQKGLVNLRVNANWDVPGYALHIFVAALKTYPRARRVRVSWHLQLPLNSANTTVLYDRHQHNVAFFSQGDGDMGAYRDHVLFSGVPEAVFVKLADAQRDGDNGISWDGYNVRDPGDKPRLVGHGYHETAWDGFDALSQYGCRARDLGSWQKAPKD